MRSRWTCQPAAASASTPSASGCGRQRSPTSCGCDTARRIHRPWLQRVLAVHGRLRRALPGGIRREHAQRSPRRWLPHDACFRKLFETQKPFAQGRQWLRVQCQPLLFSLPPPAAAVAPAAGPAAAFPSAAPAAALAAAVLLLLPLQLGAQEAPRRQALLVAAAARAHLAAGPSPAHTSPPWPPTGRSHRAPPPRCTAARGVAGLQRLGRGGRGTRCSGRQRTAAGRCTRSPRRRSRGARGSGTEAAGSGSVVGCAPGCRAGALPVSWTPQPHPVRSAPCCASPVNT